MIKTTILIPAQNAASQIAATLAPISGKGFDIIVIANGCTDDTAQVARDTAPDAFVLESPLNHKARALNLGLLGSYGDCIVCLKAGVVASAQTIEKLVQCLTTDRVDLAYGVARFDSTGSTSTVRGLCGAWQRLGSAAGVGMAGCYGLRRRALEKAGGFPVNLRGDIWLRQHFMASALCVPDAVYDISAARSLGDLYVRLRHTQYGERVQQIRRRLPNPDFTSTFKGAA